MLAEPTVEAEPVDQADAEAISGSGAIEENSPSSLEISADQEPEPLAVQDLLAAQNVDLAAAQPELVHQTLQADKPIAWSAEDRVLATAAALATIWDAVQPNSGNRVHHSRVPRSLLT